MRKAVIVGVNDYAPIGTGGPDLRGCVNDARDMANTLVICGFPPANIRILTNGNAKRQNILNYLNWLLTGCAKGDSLVFYYSGHGTRVANIGSDYEIDGLDEAICPHDYATAGVIRDDNFKAAFDGKLKPGVNLEVLFDCCHSGTGTRALPGLSDVIADDENYQKARFIEPMLEDEFYFTFAKELKPKKVISNDDYLHTSRALVPVSGMNHTLWAACRDNQVAMEGSFGGSIRGYFTYNICKILRATTGNITRKMLDALLANALRNIGAAQINQTESTSVEFGQRIFT